MQIRQTLQTFWLLIAITLTIAGKPASAGVFGEAAISIGGTYPQGTFIRYADPGFMVNARGTIHIPQMEFVVGWVGFSYVSFSKETVDTYYEGVTIIGGPTILHPVRQTTSESMVAGHIGLQLASPTQNAFFRPRAALGIGPYGFRNVITWTEEVGDSTVTLADESLDSQTSFGWRGLLGADFFVSSQLGITVDLVYDHVFELNQIDGPQADADLTSRFNGFTIGIVYMFKVK